MMAYDPNEPRDKNGKWTESASGHNAGGGNRAVANHIKKQHTSVGLELYENSHPAFKSFKINVDGRHIGHLQTESYGKRVEINDIETLTGPNSLGMHVRKLTKELKKYWPEMETVSGFRSTGARAKRGGGVTEIKVK